MGGGEREETKRGSSGGGEGQIKLIWNGSYK